MTRRGSNRNGSRGTFIFSFNYWLFTLASRPHSYHTTPTVHYRPTPPLSRFSMPLICLSFTKEVISFSIHLREEKTSEATRENKGSEKSSLLQVISSLWRSHSRYPSEHPSAQTSSLLWKHFFALVTSDWIKANEKQNGSEENPFLISCAIWPSVYWRLRGKKHRDGILWIRCAVWFMNSAGKTL